MVFFRNLIPIGMLTAIVAVAIGLNSCGSNPDNDEEQDTNPPTITLQGDNPDTMVIGQSYIDGGFSADDPEEGDVTASVTIDYGSLDTGSAKAGTFIVKYTSSDSTGNADTATRTIVVVEAKVIIITSVTHPSYPSSLSQIVTQVKTRDFEARLFVDGYSICL
jgi:hypothetical protein